MLDEGFGDHFHAVQRFVHGAEVEDQRGTYAGVLHVKPDEREFSAAGVDSIEPALDAGGGWLGAFGLDEIFGSEDKGIERRLLDGHGGAAMTEGGAGSSR